MTLHGEHFAGMAEAKLEINILSVGLICGLFLLCLVLEAIHEIIQSLILKKKILQMENQSFTA